MSYAGRSMWNRTTLLALALPTLVVTMGLQLLRVYSPSLAWYLRDTVGVGSATLGGVAFAAFLPGFFAPLIRRAFGSRGSLWFAAGGVALLRLAEQISRSPAADLWFSLTGTTCFVLFVSLFIAHARSLGGDPGYRWAGGFLLGIALDSMIKGAARSLDLSWIPGPAPIVIMAVLVVLVFLLLRGEPAPDRGAHSDVTWGEAIPLLMPGSIILLGSMLLQNQGWISQVSGLSGSMAFVVILLGNLAALAGFLAAQAWPRWFRPVSVLAAAAVVVFVTLVAIAAGSLFPLAVLVAQALLGWGLRLVSLASQASRPGVGRTSAMVTTGLILYLLLSFIYYVSLDLPLPMPREAVLPAAALVAGLAMLVATKGAQRANAVYDRTLLTPGLVLALLGAAVALLGGRAAENRADDGRLLVMTYNIHSSVDTQGRLDPEAIAQVIEASGADIVALQEISRGWLIDGATDMVDWLSRRLGMQIFFVGTADPIWGNALLSRRGFLETGSSPLPLAGTLLPRGFVWARIPVDAGEPWLVVGTHLHHIDQEPGPRLEQLEVILEFLEGNPRTLLLGDLNSEPTWPEMDLPREAGLIDAWAEAGEGPGLTWPADTPIQRLDYILHTSDLHVLSVEILDATASDHKPVLAEFSLP
ncbi:MAG TPA: endonuclease/exonuclease/phosphatase family protein [Anaerolineales bacterium]|nr:endonuclease/exonuclease/phosphatase family protein [Anaerolineales bacterium]